MKIAGFKKQSLIDYPGNISAVVFTQGCNLRCGFCHNPDLVLPEKFGNTISESVILDYLNKRKTLLDAVCITGGEPTLHKDLPNFIEKIKKLGLKVKLDSNGSHPSMLKALIKNKLIDFVAMDIKHLLNYKAYNKTVGYSISENIFKEIQESIEIIKSSGIDYEFRTTVVGGLHSISDIKYLQNIFPNLKIQNFNGDIVLNPELKFKPLINIDTLMV